MHAIGVEHALSFQGDVSQQRTACLAMMLSCEQVAWMVVPRGCSHQGLGTSDTVLCQFVRQFKCIWFAPHPSD